MTDQPEHDNTLIETDRYGDPLPQGTAMTERESYERIVDGLRIMAEGAAHMAMQDKESRQKFLDIAVRLDLVRVLVVKKAGLTEAMQQRTTDLNPRIPLSWRVARGRFRDGGKQAAGGLRQLATCHRGDLVWSRMAQSVENMANAGATPNLRRRVMLPPGMMQ